MTRHDIAPEDLEGIRQAVRDLVRVGAVKFSGEFRDGQPVWVTTELSQFAHALIEGEATEARREHYREAIAYHDAITRGDNSAAITHGRTLAELLDIPWHGLLSWNNTQ